MKRRDFIKLGAAGIAGMAWPFTGSATQNLQKAQVVVIGAGYGGATAAKYLRMWSNYNINVTLIEQSQRFISCPVSNLVLGGEKNLSDITFTYVDLVKNHGIKLINDSVEAIDPDKKIVRMKTGLIPYDRIVLSPGVSFNYEKFPILKSEAAQQAIPHAWKAGPQTENLKSQIQSIEEGGVVAITIPALPYRCPPAPYERACQIAFYLKRHKPKSKILILDANPEITSMRPRFERAWADLYPGLIDYQASSEIVDIDVKSKIVRTVFDTYQVNVLNFIPPQLAGRLALETGLAGVNSNWCDVDFITYESTKFPKIHILGDSVDSGLPKSAHMATSQAKVCASAIVSIMADQEPDPAPAFSNICYSYVNDTMAMHVANVYRFDPENKVMKPESGGGISERPSEREERDAQSWAKNIWHEVLS